MKQKLYTIKDTKTGLLTMPFTMNTEAEMLRGAKTMANSQKPNNLNQYMEDKQIWALGDFDNETGEINSKPEYLVNVISLVETKKESKEEIINANKTN